ncbi:MAG: hypothetical protein CMB80_15435 [Flammeovirgaceae bacterium]|nr:hypothetical protein [Flammeovirgaceae bacterium]MBE61731.1 hypothetical protein [Flammeovirgaceae bacterium]MBR08026.1 hypothetical protein [Rickettsiales bacterium]HCX21192.1 hypothetical protein [Cytophagales bacterium]|tara:strand:+ start:5196 stop:5786 length:591 start_codon:yes stop_codon:yes gene_type:complete
MEDNFDQLKDSWKAAKKEHSAPDSITMLKTVVENHNKSKKAHIWNAAILSSVVIGLLAFFYFLAPMQDTLSRIGIALMIGGLIVRIVIELISHQKASGINYAASSEESAGQAKDFYNYRKKIHGPVTAIIIALYTIGFYSLTPEFSRYFSTFWMWMMDGSYLVIGIILFVGIRKGVVQEMRDLKRINEIQSAINES